MRFLGILAVWLLTTSVLYGKMPYDAVAVLNRPNNGGGGSGTLVAKIGDKGLILSEAHVFHNATEVEAYWPAFKEKRTAKVIYASYLYDTALLVVENPPCDPVPLALGVDSKEPIYLVGFPWYSRDALHWQEGKIETYYPLGIHDYAMAYTTCRPAGGMSGGPAFNKRGSIIGTVKAVQNDGTGGVIMTNEAVVPIIMAFTDPETWVPITSHLRPDWKGKSAARERTDFTEQYDEQSAPDLEPEPGDKTKVPAEK